MQEVGNEDNTVCSATKEVSRLPRLEGLVDVEIQLERNFGGSSNRYVEGVGEDDLLADELEERAGSHEVSHAGMSVSDVTIRRCNNMILQNLSTKAAGKMW